MLRQVSGRRLLDRGHGRRFLSRGAAVAAAALILIGTSPTALAAGQPMAAARDFCSPGDPNSVTVVVDFSGVGGGVDIRCAPVSAGATGAQALSAAGFGIAGTVHDGPGFVCRIDGEPASDPCVDTPSTSAYWSYHQAEAGGGWSYSSRGYTSSRVKPGGFEGWSFGSGGSPGVSPVLPAAPAPEPEPEPEPAPEAQQPADQPADPAAPQADTGAGAGESTQDGDPAPAQDPATTADDADGAAAQAAADAQAAAEAQTSSEAQAAADAAAAQAAAEAAAAQAAAESAAALAAQSAAASSSAAATTPSSPRSTAGGPVTSSADSSAVSANEPADGSTIWFSVIALLAVASLGSAAVVMSRRRRLGASGGADGAGAGTTDGPGDGAGHDDRTG